VQSERLTIYREHAETLVRGGHAYYAFDTAEELEQNRNSRSSRPGTTAGR
jgi:glutamyl-tRNA synthetase